MDRRKFLSVAATAIPVAAATAGEPSASSRSLSVIDWPGITWDYAGDTTGWPYGEFDVARKAPESVIDADAFLEERVAECVGRIWDRMCHRARVEGVAIERIQMALYRSPNIPERAKAYVYVKPGEAAVVCVARFLPESHPGVQHQIHHPKHDIEQPGRDENGERITIPAAVKIG